MSERETPEDLHHLQRAFALALRARELGDRPFGAVIAAPIGVLVQASSLQGAGGGTTAHAEMNALRAAIQTTDRSILAKATLYASTEPCAMCSAATFYAGVGRIVFGLSEQRLRPLRNKTSRGAGLALSCRDILDRGSRSTCIVGPVLEDEAFALHEGYWERPV